MSLRPTTSKKWEIIVAIVPILPGKKPERVPALSIVYTGIFMIKTEKSLKKTQGFEWLTEHWIDLKIRRPF
jgi:hypothetical protein